MHQFQDSEGFHGMQLQNASMHLEELKLHAFGKISVSQLAACLLDDSMDGMAPITPWNEQSVMEASTDQSSNVTPVEVSLNSAHDDVMRFSELVLLELEKEEATWRHLLDRESGIQLGTGCDRTISGTILTSDRHEIHRGNLIDSIQNGGINEDRISSLLSKYQSSDKDTFSRDNLGKDETLIDRLHDTGLSKSVIPNTGCRPTIGGDTLDNYSSRGERFHSSFEKTKQNQQGSGQSRSYSTSLPWKDRSSVPISDLLSKKAFHAKNSDASADIDTTLASTYLIGLRHLGLTADDGGEWISSRDRDRSNLGLDEMSKVELDTVNDQTNNEHETSEASNDIAQHGSTPSREESTSDAETEFVVMRSGDIICRKMMNLNINT